MLTGQPPQTGTCAVETRSPHGVWQLVKVQDRVIEQQEKEGYHREERCRSLDGKTKRASWCELKREVDVARRKRSVQALDKLR